jgi:hypothetical protein
MKNSRIKVVLSDPWDLGESLKWQPLIGELVKFDFKIPSGRALIKLEQPLSYKGIFYQFAVAVPRHADCNFKTLQEGKKVFCSFIGISNEHAQSVNALSTEHWRSGLAFVGEIEILV